MLSLDRFKTLTRSYGAAPDRWPHNERAEAELLLQHSAQARQLVEEARALDVALGFTHTANDDGLELHAGGLHAGAAPGTGAMGELNQLRSAVTQRISHAVREQPRRRARLGWLPGKLAWNRGSSFGGSHLGWVGAATGGSLVIAAGLLIGWMQAPQPTPVDVDWIPFLQPAPVHSSDEWTGIK
jgi:hypothetical protein